MRLGESRAATIGGEGFEALAALPEGVWGVRCERTGGGGEVTVGG